MANLLYRIKNSKYLKSIATLISGSIIAQIIVLIASPITTRIYTPEQLGIYTLITTFISIFGPVICGKYDSSIVVAKDEEETFNLIGLCLIISIIFTGIVAVFYQIYLNSNLAIKEEMGFFAQLMSVMLLITGLTNILIAYNNRNSQYKLISSVTVKRTVFQYIFQICFGLAGLKSIGLILSSLGSAIIGIRKQSSYLFTNKEKFKAINKAALIGVLTKYKKQFLFSMPAIFINSSAYSILNFFISDLYGVDTFGYYSLSYRMLGLPLALISTNVSRVFFQQASEEYKNKGIYTKSLSTFSLVLLVCAIPMVILLMIFSPFMFEIFFGKGWGVSGQYVAILAPMYGIRLIVSALTPALIISNRQSTELILQIMFIVCSILIYIICRIYSLSIVVFLIAISVLFSLVYIVVFFRICKLGKDKNMNK